MPRPKPYILPFNHKTHTLKGLRDAGPFLLCSRAAIGIIIIIIVITISASVRAAMTSSAMTVMIGTFVRLNQVESSAGWLGTRTKDVGSC